MGGHPERLGAEPVRAERTTVRIQCADFDVGEELAQLRRNSPGTGAIASFVGVVRDVNDERSVGSMFLEHYPGMTERAIGAIVTEARARWDLHAVSVVHRVGTLEPSDQIVLVAVASTHRGDAFRACEFVMDFLKTRAPFWKSEATAQGPRWVEARTSDDEAAGRWQGPEGGGAST